MDEIHTRQELLEVVVLSHPRKIMEKTIVTIKKNQPNSRNEIASQHNSYKKYVCSCNDSKLLVFQPLKIHEVNGGDL